MSRESAHDPYYEINRRRWDQAVPVHEASADYNRAGFLRGEKPLCPVERAELGPHIDGRTLLHLQCHFGMDTLNWARLGAGVTGLDFSAPAIEAARRLSADSGIPARFVVANVYEAPVALGERYDIVYTGIGALNWIPDIRAWARVAAACSKPGGRLYIYEGHPVLWALDERPAESRLVLKYPYFELSKPTITESATTYVDGPPLDEHRMCEWNHGLGEIVSAVIDAGFRIEFLHEHTEVPWKALPNMEQAPPVDGARHSNRMWRLPEPQRSRTPLMYSLMAIHSPQ